VALLSDEPDAIPERVGGDELWYELHVGAPETPKTGCYEVFVGVEVRSLPRMHPRCSAKLLPAAEYAVVTARGAEMDYCFPRLPPSEA